MKLSEHDITLTGTWCYPVTDWPRIIDLIARGRLPVEKVVTAQVPIEHAPNPHNEAYLRAKRDRMGHTLHHQGLALDEQMVHDEAVHDRERQGS